jgi:hypothetical protein
MSAREHDDAELRLSAAIGAAREQWPDRDALARVREGVAAAVGSPAPVSGSAQARILRRSLRGAWLRGGGSLALVLAAGYGALRLHAGVAPEPALVVGAPVVHAQAAATTVAPVQQEPLAAVVTPQPPEPELAAPQKVEPRRKVPRLHLRAPAVVHAAAESAAPSDPEAELALLRRALAALQAHPKQSLDLVAEHERLYAQGIFGQEREVIAIDALLALQQTSAAEARARAFLARYPRSAHAPRIRTLLGGDTANGSASAPAQRGGASPPQMALGQSPR